MDKKKILITGCSSGIGFATASYLAGKQINVIATVRKQEDFSKFDNLEHKKFITPMMVDVTDQQSVNELIQTITAKEFKIGGLVNNAGIAYVKPLVETPQQEFEGVFAVNLFGVHRMVRALFPFLKETQGRIVNISSLSGTISNLFFGAYSAADHGVEAYTDALAQELDRFGIRVAAIEPGAYKTEAGRNILKNFGFFSEDSLYEEKVYLNERAKKIAQEPEGADPIAVAQAVYDALTNPNPLRRYMVVPALEPQQRAINKAIEEMLQLNQYGKYSFSKEEILTMITNMWHKLQPTNIPSGDKK